MRSCSRSLAGVCATVRFGLAGLPVDDGAAVSNRPMLPQAESVNAAHSKRRRSQKAAACHSLAPSRTFRHVRTHAWLLVDRFLVTVTRRLVPAEHFNLPHPEHFDPRPASAPRQSRGHESVDFRGT